MSNFNIDDFGSEGNLTPLRALFLMPKLIAPQGRRLAHFGELANCRGQIGNRNTWRCTVSPTRERKKVPPVCQRDVLNSGMSQH
jgi:hypothetical protein